MIDHDQKGATSLAVTGIPQEKKEHILSILKHDICGELEQCSTPAPSYSQRGIAMTSPSNSLKSSNSDACELLNTDTDTAMFIAAYNDANVVSAYTDDDDDADTERIDLKKNGCFPRAPIRLGSNRKDGERTKRNMRRMTSNSNLHDNEVNKDYDTPLCGLTYACISLLSNKADDKERECSRNESIDDSSVVGSDSSAKFKRSFPLLEADLARYAANASTFKVNDNDDASSGILSILGLYSTRNAQQSERDESSIVDDHQNKVESKCVDKLQSKAIIAVDFSWKCSKSTRKAKSNPINQMMLASLVGTAASEAADAAPTTSSQEDGFSEQILDHEKGESHVKSGLINNLLASMATLCYNVDDTRDTVILNTGLDDNPQSQPNANCVETSSPKIDEVVQERNEESDPFSVGSTFASSGAALVSTRLESEYDMAINDDYSRLDEGEEVEYVSAVSMPDGSVNCQKPKERKGGLTIVVYDSKESGLESKHIVMQSVIPSVTGHTVEINEEKEEIKQPFKVTR